MLQTLTIAVVFPVLLYAQTRELMQKLHKYVLSDPSVKFTPFIGNDTLVDVALTFTPGAILDLDPETQILTLTGSLIMKWTDPALTWNASRYNGLSHLTLEKDEVWTPNILLLNGKDRLEVVKDRSGSVVTLSNGTVVFNVIDEFKVTCKIDVSDFPFDQQQCKLLLSPHPLDYINLVLYVIKDVTFGALLVESAEWELVDVYTQATVLNSERERPLKSATLTLKRRSLFYVTNIIFPMTLTSIMNAGVFILPASSGEKVSYLVTIFVSHAIFLNFIYDITPRASTNIPRMTSYLMGILGQGFLALVATAVVLHLHQRNSTIQPEGNTDEQSTLKERKEQLKIVACLSNANKLDCFFFFVFLSIAILNTIVALN